MSPESYDRHREQAADNQREKSRAGREIGEIPAVVDPKRRESCRLDLARFLRTYFPNAFKLKFSADHVRIVEKIQRAILSGGLLSIAMPRGSGKTTICERAVLWAAIYGHCPFPLLVAADQKKSAESLAKLKLELEANPLLLADFPEVCYPIRKLERIANRVKGQTYQGEPTRMEWSRLAIVLPTIPGSVSSGAVIKTGAILSAVRGANHTKPDGTVVRPSLVLLDDPQTRASARKETQSKLREQIISADVLGCAGPGETMTALMTCTVICKGDMADRMLDRSLHPDWQGERTKLLIRWPSDPAMALWQELREKLADAMARDASPEAVLKIGVAFYRKHRAAMDDGAEVAWEERREKGHPSALYSAMMLYFKDPEAFWSEYQNEPMGGVTDSEELQTPDRLARRVNKLPRGTIPLQAQHVTASIDVQKDGLYWMISWFQDNFTGGVADYAVYPEQQKHQFTVRDLSPTLRTFTKRKSWQAALRCGLDALFDLLATRRFQRPDGATMSIERILVDANWGDSTEIVYQACRESAHSAILRPAHGIAIKPTRRPMSDMKTDGSDKPGDHWIERTHAKFKSRYAEIDIEKRTMLTLPGGYTMQQFKAEQPTTTYGDFKNQILNEIARCLNMPFNVAAGNSAGYNYSSGRLDHQIYFRSIGIDQADCESDVLDRLFAAWLDEAALIPGLIPAGLGPFYLWRHTWAWDPAEDLDPVKTAQARLINLASGMTSFDAEFAAKGLDRETEMSRMAESLGITLPEYQGLLRQKILGDVSAVVLQQEQDNTVNARLRRRVRRLSAMFSKASKAAGSAA